MTDVRMTTSGGSSFKEIGAVGRNTEKQVLLEWILATWRLKTRALKWNERLKEIVLLKQFPMDVLSTERRGIKLLQMHALLLTVLWSIPQFSCRHKFWSVNFGLISVLADWCCPRLWVWFSVNSSWWFFFGKEDSTATWTDGFPPVQLEVLTHCNILSTGLLESFLLSVILASFVKVGEWTNMELLTAIDYKTSICILPSKIIGMVERFSKNKSEDF